MQCAMTRSWLAVREILLLRVILLSSAALASGRSEPPRPNELHLLVLSPYPRNGSNVGWAGGPALFPAAEFAADLINNRTDILPETTLRLVDGDSGCAYGSEALVTYAREREIALRSHRRFVGIVGPACSAAAAEIGGVTTAEYADVVSLTIANSPYLHTHKLNNMLRLYSSAQLSARALLMLMQREGWTSVAAVVDFSHWYYPQIYSSFKAEIIATSVERYSVELLNFHSPLTAIRNRYNVVVVFADTYHSAEFLCKAKQLNLLFPDYQWVFFDIELDALTYGKFTCSCQEMREGAHRAIVFSPRLTVEDKTAVHVPSELSYNEFLKTYREYYMRHLQEVRISRDDVGIGAEYWAAAYFDAVWAFALAVHHSFEANLAPNPLATSTIREQLLSLNFSGLSGDINFSRDTLAVPSPVDIYQMDKDKSMLIKIGSFHEETLTISKDAVFVRPIQKKVVVVYTVAVALFFSTGIIVLALIGGVHLIYVVFRHYKSIRAQSPHFVHIIFSGCYLYLLAALLDTIRVANWTGYSDIDSPGFRISISTICNTLFWCLSLSTTLIFGTMCVLSWRIYRIFTHFLNPGLWISDPILAGFIGILVTINVVVLVTWSTSDPLLVEFELADKGLKTGVLPYYQHCDCEYFGSWLALWALNEAVIFLVVVFSFLNRHVPKKDYVNNTRSYNGTVYIMSFVNGVCIPIHFALSNTNSINLSYVFFQLLTVGSPLTALLLLFLPPILPLLRSTMRRNTMRYPYQGL